MMFCDFAQTIALIEKDRENNGLSACVSKVEVGDTAVCATVQIAQIARKLWLPSHAFFSCSYCIKHANGCSKHPGWPKLDQQK